MIFPLNLSDNSLWLAVTAIILLVISELLFSFPDYSARIAIEKNFLRRVGIGCGFIFLLTVVMRIMGVSADRFIPKK